jgi:hypothetical protein
MPDEPPGGHESERDLPEMQPDAAKTGQMTVFEWRKAYILN